MVHRQNATTSKTRKKETALLLALAQLGGEATKQDTLDHIENCGWYRTTEQERRPATRRKEAVWRNRFAYLIKTLKGPKRAEVDGPSHGSWAITEAGRMTLSRSLKSLIAERNNGISVAPLTQEFMSAAGIHLSVTDTPTNPTGSHEDDKDGRNGLPPRSRHWSSGETMWHKQTVAAIADDPSLIGIEPHRVARRWNDSLLSSEDGRRLWLKLRTEKRPDVVFELCDGSLCVVEVEPLATVFEGIGQVAGDYIVNLRVDRVAASRHAEIVSFLVTEGPLSSVAAQLAADLRIRLVEVPRS